VAAGVVAGGGDVGRAGESVDADDLDTVEQWGERGDLVGLASTTVWPSTTPLS
jgi:hypothetical protein